MIRKTEWNDACRDVIAEGRKRIEPPTVEDVEALYRGELSDDEADRVREQLAYYPEMAAAMTDEQLAADLAAADAQESPVTAPVPFPAQRRFPWLGIAASIIVVLALSGIYLKFRHQGSSRHVLTRVLDADGPSRGTRGPAGEQTPAQLSTEADYLLKPAFRPTRSFDEYRLELVDLGTSPPRLKWTRSGVQRAPDGTFPAELSTEDLEPGLYELVLYGVDGGRSDRLATYTIRFDGL
jgi:hypothetical protein